jgi:hypothetical protein
MAALKSGPLYRAEERRERWEIIRTSLSIQSTRAWYFAFESFAQGAKSGWLVLVRLRPHSAPLSMLPLDKSAKQKLCTTQHIAGLKNKSDALNLATQIGF